MISLLIFIGTVFAGDEPWSYTGDHGPEHWGELNPDYILCAEGKNQSPIDLAGFIEAEIPEFQLHYSSNATRVLNNGHTIEVAFQTGSTLTIAGSSFELKQFHVHAPSENTIDGQHFPMEVHLVHANADKQLAVVAVMLADGPANELLAVVWAKIPESAGESLPIAAGTTAQGLLPNDLDVYLFNGSLTTPPCSEGVRWLVMKTPMTASAEQIEAFKHVMHHPNNRPVQPVNARPVLK